MQISSSLVAHLQFFIALYALGIFSLFASLLLTHPLDICEL